MSILRILIDVADGAQTVADDMRLIGDAPSNSRDIEALASYIEGIKFGKPAGAKIRVNVGGVQAVNRVTFASFTTGDTVTLNGNTLTGDTTFLVGASNEACANNLKTYINSTSALAKIVNTVKAIRRATIAMSSFANGDYVTINGVIFTGKTTPTDGQRHFAIGASDTVTAANLAALLSRADIPSPINGITASAATGTVTLTFDGSLTVAASAHATVASDMVDLYAIVPGTLGNLFTLAISAHGSVTGANFASGAEGTAASVTIDAGRVAV